MTACVCVYTCKKYIFVHEKDVDFICGAIPRVEREGERERERERERNSKGKLPLLL